jgi:hypothetical protein
LPNLYSTNLLHNRPPGRNWGADSLGKISINPHLFIIILLSITPFHSSGRDITQYNKFRHHLHRYKMGGLEQ